MLDGFNEGWICFAEDGGRRIRGTTSLADVVGRLVADAKAAEAA
jgi:hypothetical protein